jgi:hypothetical protein
MKTRGIKLVLGLSAMALAAAASAQQAGSSGVGSATVKVATDPSGVPGAFDFSGAPAGTTGAGGEISATGLSPGQYSSVASNAPAGLVLVSVSCDDGDSAVPSNGQLAVGGATFNVEADEAVTCVFLYRSQELAGSATQPGAPGAPYGSGGAAPGGGSGVPSPGLPGGGEGEPGDCDEPELVPKAGRWKVSNFAGRMVCGSMINMPLKASEEAGMLEIRECGWTVIGTGLAEDTAPLTMRAVDATSGRYTGSVGGEQDGIPMTIDFTWQLNSDESIVGELQSQVTQQGMTCNMTRPFELRFTGP